jgi:hypothetical protein
VEGTKPYQLVFEYHAAYLHAFVSGTADSLAISTAYWQDITKECLRGGYQRVLAEEDFPHAISDEDMVRLISHAPDELLGIKIAFVDRHTDHNSLLAESLAAGRGMTVRVFFSLDVARTWLLSDVQVAQAEY